jgi:uncharacterized Tic20 family protein
MVWVLPLLGVLLGTLIVWQVLRSWRQQQNGLAAPALANPNTIQQISPELMALVEKELKKND